MTHKPSSPTEHPKRLIMGRIGAPYGVKGWLKVTSYTHPKANILQYSTWQVKAGQQWQSLSPAETQTQGNALLVKLANCNTPEEAQQWTNATIAIYHNELPQLADDEYYWNDLIHSEVVTDTGTHLGTVTRLLETGSNDVFVVEGDQRHLIPYTDDCVTHIDTHNHIITVDWTPID